MIILKTVKLEGIVIKEIDFKESSKILTVLTRERGAVSIISKGCKKLSSKLRSASLKLTYAYFYVNYKEDGLSNLIEAEIINNFRNIMLDIEKISYVSYILDLTSQIVKENKNYNDIFDIMINGIIKINEGLDERIITNIIEVKYLKYLGISPVLDSCSICGSFDNITTISVKHGGYVCKNCYVDGKIYHEKVIKLIKLFDLVDISKVTKLEIKDNIINDIDEFLSLYYNEYTGLYLKSKSFLKKIVR